MDDFSDLQDDEFNLDDPDFSSDFPSTSSPDDSDQFDQLRRSSARSETMFDDFSEEELQEESGGSESGFSMSNFTPIQRIILAVLVVLNIMMIGFGLLVILGVVGG